MPVPPGRPRAGSASPLAWAADAATAKARRHLQTATRPLLLRRPAVHRLLGATRSWTPLPPLQPRPRRSTPGFGKARRGRRRPKSKQRPLLAWPSRRPGKPCPGIARQVSPPPAPHRLVVAPQRPPLPPPRLVVRLPRAMWWHWNAALRRRLSTHRRSSIKPQPSNRLPAQPSRRRRRRRPRQRHRRPRQPQPQPQRPSKKEPASSAGSLGADLRRHPRRQRRRRPRQPQPQPQLQRPSKKEPAS